MIDADGCGAVGGMNDWQGKPKYSKRTCPNASLATTDLPLWWEVDSYGMHCIVTKYKPSLFDAF
jgi:hypothetical protein